jgi:4-hydroxy-2-oxoheptanedioate aldolase
MLHNRLRALLNAGEPSIGTNVLSSWPTLAELIDITGIALTIEKREGVEDLDAVLSIEGIDMVPFGSSDYSMSFGLTGRRTQLPTGEARQ